MSLEANSNEQARTPSSPEAQPWQPSGKDKEDARVSLGMPEANDQELARALLYSDHAGRAQWGEPSSSPFDGLTSEWKEWAERIAEIG